MEGGCLVPLILFSPLCGSKGVAECAWFPSDRRYLHPAQALTASSWCSYQSHTTSLSANTIANTNTIANANANTNYISSLNDIAVTCLRYLDKRSLDTIRLQTIKKLLPIVLGLGKKIHDYIYTLYRP